MAVNLGSSAVSLYLGSQSVNAYLGGTLVTPPAGITLYYNNAEEDGNWNTLGNWWQDSGHTVAATALPTAAESVVATATINSNSGSALTVANFTLNDPDSQGPSLQIELTVTGIATFNGTSSNSGVLYGNATFNGGSYNSFTVTGTATFNDSACNNGGTAGTFVPDPPPSC